MAFIGKVLFAAAVAVAAVAALNRTQMGRKILAS